jgi:hypothetical protein
VLDCLNGYLTLFDALLAGSGLGAARLGWPNRLSFRDALAWTIDWGRRVHARVEALTVTGEQITTLESLE